MERIKTLHPFLSASRLGASRVTGLFISHRSLRQSDSKHQHAMAAWAFFSLANKISKSSWNLLGFVGCRKNTW